ncbi:Cell division and transport-associated protein TolA [Roseovarius litoreus]|uniref:Cell division and transport-associated protein TolA n=1 Tax=Roseovarius litoreus TaxID=1155722 RepID=A0A1M6ZLA8_9RHOB|nr:energy transducer TonB [Roseovarius litoreus]SHL31143.1 Cell division and transport-associated protein TolA [Roseovarius litoreus]
MNTGQIISGTAHIGLIAFAVFGGAFKSDPLPFEVTSVTAISAEEYAALIDAPRAPEAVANVDTPEPPAEGQGLPELTSTSDAAPDLSQPEVTQTPPPDNVPEVVDPVPVPEAEVSDEPPVMQPPQEDVAALVPEVSPRPQPRPAPRVAPEAVAPPEPDVAIDEVERQETVPDAEAAENIEPETEATAPEEATTEIVTEAEQVDPASAAPSRSLRPKTRPAQPQTAQPQTAEQTQPAEDTRTAARPQPDESAVNDALAEALGQAGGADQGAPSGPPLTAGEKDALRVSVQQCWNVGSLSSEALRTTVVVKVRMGEDAKPVSGSIELLSSSGGSDAAARQAYEAARRAIIRCGANGYDLPKDKYDHWRDIEMTFNPERMRIK